MQSAEELSSKKTRHYLLAIVVFSFLLKNPFIVQPFLGHFGSYQAIVAMIASEFAKNNFQNFLSPNSFLLVNGLPALEIIYHPFCAFVAALAWKIFGGSLDYWGRMQAMVFSALSCMLMYLSAKKTGYSKRFALWAAYFLAFSPMSLIYGRSLMNESMALCLFILSFLLLQLWMESRKIVLLFASGVVLSFVLILRLHFIPAFLPFSYLILSRATKGKRTISMTVFLVSASLLTGLWFWHTYQIAINAPSVHTSLFVQVQKRGFPDPLLFSALFYQKVFAKEFLFRLSGPIASILIAISFFLGFAKKNLWIIVFFASFILMIIFLPSKFYDHPFYLLPFVYPGALLAASVSISVIEKFKKIKIVLIALVLISNTILFWKPAFTEPPDQSAVLDAAKFIRSQTNPGDRIVALYGTSAAFLYYLNRYGNSFQIRPDRITIDTYMMEGKFEKLSQEEFQKKILAYQDSILWLEYLKEKNGIKYFAAVPKLILSREPGFSHYLNQNYSLISPENSDFVLYRLERRN